MPTLTQTKNLLRVLPLILLCDSLALSGCSDLPETTESYDTMPKDTERLDAKFDKILETNAATIQPLRAKTPASLQPADTSDPDKLPPYVLSGPSLITFEQAGDRCHLLGRQLPKMPITGLENLRYYLAGGLFVRMGNVVGNPDPGSQMIGWIVCEP